MIYEWKKIQGSLPPAILIPLLTQHLPKPRFVMTHRMTAPLRRRVQGSPPDAAGGGGAALFEGQQGPTPGRSPSLFFLAHYMLLFFSFYSFSIFITFYYNTISIFKFVRFFIPHPFLPVFFYRYNWALPTLFSLHNFCFCYAILYYQILTVFVPFILSHSIAIFYLYNLFLILLLI